MPLRFLSEAHASHTPDSSPDTWASIRGQFFTFIASPTSFPLTLVSVQVGEAKNTVPLIQKSLETCEVLVGRRFSAKNLPPYISAAANREDEATWRNCLLLWPSSQSEYLGGEHGMCLLDEVLATRKSKGPEDDSVSPPMTTIVLIDGTWASCSHIFINSPLLQKLRRVRISPTEPCRQVYKHTMIKTVITYMIACHVLFRHSVFEVYARPGHLIAHGHGTFSLENCFIYSMVSPKNCHCHSRRSLPDHSVHLRYFHV